MARDSKGSALAQYGPVAAPIIGIVVAVAFIAVAVVTNPIPEKKDRLTGTLQTIDRQLTGGEVVQADTVEAPVVDSVSEMLTPDRDDGWRPPGITNRMVALPIRWNVLMEGPQESEFDRLDTDGNGSLSEEEFRLSDFPKLPDGDPRRKFENWDRDNDGVISEEEFKDPPASDEQRFNEIGGGASELTEEHISPKEISEWDRYPYDGKIDLDEFRRRYEPHESRDFAPARGVRAAVDPADMAVVVTWQAPDAIELPGDISYIIWRLAPETVERRRSVWRDQMRAFDEEYRKWEREHFTPWWDNLSNGYKDAHGLMTPTQGRQHFRGLDAEGWYRSVNTNAYRRHAGLPTMPEDATEQQKADVDAESRGILGEVFSRITRVEPVQPPEPDEWERVTAVPVTGNEYRDKDFEMGVTYTYAVQMGSAAHPPKRDFVDVTSEDQSLEGVEQYYKHNERTLAETPPVRVSNRVSISYDRGTMDSSTLKLTTWYKHVADGRVNWYRLRITEQFSQNQDVGGVYGYSALLERAAVAIDVNGAEVAADVILESGMGGVDFTTGFRYSTRVGSEVLLDSREFGEFAIPTRGTPPADTTSPLGMDSPMEVRALAVKSGGGSAWFELSRWHKTADGTWLRVVVRRQVAKGQETGLSTTLGATGTRVYNSAGREVESRDLAAYGDEQVDMTAGEFDGVREHAVSVDGTEFDLFGTLYVDK